jgi:hypothetical protein
VRVSLRMADAGAAALRGGAVTVADIGFSSPVPE